MLPYVDHPEEFQFATPLKKFCIEVLGLTHDQCYGSSADRESPTNYFWGGVAEHIRIQYGKNPNDRMTARDILQVVGTDLLRKGLSRNIWAEGGIRGASQSTAQTCIFSDTRFPNEIDVTKTATSFAMWDKVILIRLYRKTGLNDGHESETALDIYDLYPNQREIVQKDHKLLEETGYTLVNQGLWKGDSSTIYDYLIDNNHTLDSLRENVVAILKDQDIYSEPSCS